MVVNLDIVELSTQLKQPLRFSEHLEFLDSDQASVPPGAFVIDGELLVEGAVPGANCARVDLRVLVDCVAGVVAVDVAQNFDALVRRTLHLDHGVLLE